MSERVYKPKTNAYEYRLDGWTLCVRTNSLQRADVKVELENRLVLLLLFFIDHKAEVLDKELILKTIWQGKVVNDDSLAVAISHLRKALGDNSRAPQYIKTIPGVGYQFIGNAEAIESKPKPEPKPEFTATETTLPESGSTEFTTPTTALNVAIHKYRNRWFVGGLAVLALALGVGAYALINTKNDASLEQALTLTQQQLASDDPQSLRAAVGSFRKILQTHPHSALAYAGIAEAKTKLLQEQLAIKENCAEVIGFWDKAVQLDENLAQAWIERGNSLFWCKRDYAAAEQSYLRAIELRPQDDYAPLQYSQLLLTLARFEDSMRYLESARQLNPLNYSAPTVAWVYQMQQRDDLALQELERIQRAEPDTRWFHISAQRVYASLGREQESFKHWRWLMENAGFSNTDLQAVSDIFESAGLTQVNRWLLERKESADLGQYKPPLSWARYALAAGEQEQALDYLEQSLAARQTALLWACVDPAYDAVRHHPRFQAILAQLEQPEFTP